MDTGLAALEWAARAQRLGAGELLVTSMDQDGTNDGYDTALLAAVRRYTDIPVIASGGAGEPSDLVEAITVGGAEAVLAASIFHRGVHTIGDVKDSLAASGVPVREIA